MPVRAKFNVQKVTHVSWNKEARIVELGAVYDQSTPENERYSKATPSGTITMQIDNPPAAEQFEIGKTFYVDFTEAQ